MKFGNIISEMERIADPKLACEWDNSGVQIYSGKDDIKKIMIALEITRSVIGEARDRGIDLIITHHPLFFEPVVNIDSNTVTGNYAAELIKAGISVYSAHTNFDEAKGGNNDYLSSLLKLAGAQKIGDSAEGTGRAGELPAEMPFEGVCAYVKESLALPHIITVGNPAAQIRKAGLCCGSGSHLIEAAAKACCDLFITGDIKYHTARYALERGICLIDAGHYGTEKFFAENLAGRLAAVLKGEAEIISAALDIDPFSVY